MKEVWKTVVLEAPEDIVPKGKGYIICHITIDGIFTGQGLNFLTQDQKEELKTYYENNYKP